MSDYNNADFDDRPDYDDHDAFDDLPDYEHEAIENDHALETAYTAEVPLPLTRGNEEEIEFPIESLDGLLSDAIASIQDATQAPVSMIANAVLANAAISVQGIANVVVDGRTTPLSLFFLTLAASGERKTAVDKLATAALRKFEVDAREAYTTGYLAYQAQLNACDKDLNGASVPPTPPVNPSILHSDFSLDGLRRQIINGPMSQGIVMSEGGNFLGGYAMSKENRIRMATTLSDVFSGEQLSSLRVRESSPSRGERRLSIHIQAQPEIAGSFVGDEALQAQGLLQRFLMAAPKPSGFREYKPFNIQRDPRYQAYNDRVSTLITQSQAGSGAAATPLRELSLDEEANKLWVQSYNFLEKLSAPGGELENYRPYISKLPDQILRLSGVITLFEDPEATTVSVQAVDNAWTLADFYFRQARQLLLLPDAPEIAQAEALLKWLKKQEMPIAFRDIYRYGPNSLRKAEKARRLLDVLINHGWVIPAGTEVRCKDDKRSRDTYMLVQEH